MYDLAEQKLLKTLTPGSRWISSMDIHPSGDHLIVGGYDRKLCWFDLELSARPYKVLRCATLSFRVGLLTNTAYLLQIPCSCPPRSSLPSDIPALCVSFGRWLSAGFPCQSFLRLDDGPVDRAAEDPARSCRARRPRSAAARVGAEATIPGQRRRGRKRGRVVCLMICQGQRVRLGRCA
jgi:hypothetical protein